MNSRYKESLIQCPDGILTINQNRDVLVVNPAMLETLNVKN
jgi:hypothetical protein